MLAQSRQQVISAGHNPAEVDAFIAKEGGPRVSDQRLLSAFGVGGAPGTSNNVATPGGGSAPTGGMTPPMGGGMTSAMPDSMAGLAKVVAPSPGIGGGGMDSLAGIGGAMNGGAGVGGGMIGDASGSLRSLGRRMPPMESSELAQRGKRVY